MPVRIIFRGLILFHFPKAGEDNAGKLVACLINNPAFTGGIDESSKPHKGHGKWEHDHSAEIQVLSEETLGSDKSEGNDKPNRHHPKPIRLERHVNVDIVVRSDSHTSVSRLRSFDDHVPHLETIIEKVTDEISKPGRSDANRNRELIQNVVTVDRGVARVKKVINWDQDGYPLSGNPAERGGRPGAAAQLKFMGSSVRGHMASEVVVEIEDATSIDLFSNSDDKELKGRRNGPLNPNHRIPPGTVEVVVTNYEFRREGPVAWGLDYQWLFETVGYEAVALNGHEFTGWAAFARRYDRGSFESETRLLLGGWVNPFGRPFPYIESVDSLALLRPLTDDYNPPVCAFGQTTFKVP